MMETEETTLPGFVIATRQKADLLFGPIEEPLEAAASVTLDVMRVAGYGRVSFLAVSEQPFQILIEEACSPEGVFSEAATLVSALDATTGLQFVADHVFPSGTFMQVTVTNTGAVAAAVDLCAHGLPHSSGGP
jgi:hypothetical protein